MARSSDRWVTPAVVCTALVVGGLLVLAVVASVTWLTAQGRDPDPMLRLTAQVVTAVGSLGTLVLQAAGRATTAKVERNVGRLEGVVVETLDQLDARAILPPVPDPTRPHPFPRHSAAPASGGR